MSSPSGWTSRVRRLATLVIALGLIIGLMSSAPPSEAAPKFDGRKCSDKYKINKPPSSRNDFPSADEIAEIGELALEYVNPAEPRLGTKYPVDKNGKPLTGKQLLKKYGTNYEAHAPGSVEHLFARFNVYRAKKGAKALGYDKYLSSYVNVFDNKARGDAFERFIVEKFGLHNDNWYCQVTFDIDGKKKKLRIDMYNSKTGEIHELKSGNKADYKQLREYKKLARKIGAKPGRVVFGGDPKPSMIKGVKKTGWRATQARTNQVLKGPTQNGTSRTFNPTPNKPTSGGAVDRLAQGSGRSPVESARIAENYRNLGGQRVANQGLPRPGGIDWSTLDLNYLSENDEGGVNYAFDADENPNVDESPSYGGAEALKLSSDAFFTWLAIPDEKLWVSLNPDEPDEVMDPRLGTTDAGRVLLVADLEMKKIAGNKGGLTDPSTPTGQALWDSLKPNPDGSVCWPMSRMWIKPKRATVRQDQGELYILDAPLAVNGERMHFDNVPGGSCEEVSDEDVLDHNQQMYEKHIVREIEKLVNTEPEFADLRRVFRARIAAAWVKDRNAKNPGAYAGIVDSGNVKRWRTETDWTPEDTYDEFLEDWSTVQYEVERKGEHNGKPFHWVYEMRGGVEFEKSPRKRISAKRFARKHPELPKKVRESRRDPANGEGTNVLLGGGTFAEDDPSPEPKPTPEPTPKPEPKPKPKPSPTRTSRPDPEPTATKKAESRPTPKPRQTSPETDPTTSSPTPESGGDGLADTGGPALVPGIAGTAAILLGAGLLALRRRRHS